MPYHFQAFLEEGVEAPNVWAHESILKAFNHMFTGVRKAHFHRSIRQFGVFLPESVSSGIGHKLDFGKQGRSIGVIYPTKFVEGDEQDVVLSGEMQTHTFTHAHSQTQTFTHATQHTRPKTHAKHTHVHTHPNARAHTHIHTQTRSCTHTHTHTYLLNTHFKCKRGLRKLIKLHPLTTNHVSSTPKL